MTDKGREAAVFLDRDGTINIDVGYLSDPDELRLIGGAARAIKRLNGHGIKAVVITNQSGVARGLVTEEDLGRINSRLVEILGSHGAVLDGIYFCPHHPDEGCRCRKPAAGLVERAVRELDIDPARSYVVGDKAADVGLARGSGAKAVLVLTGEGAGELKKLADPPDYVAAGLEEAVDWILDDMGASSGREPSRPRRR